MTIQNLQNDRLDPLGQGPKADRQKAKTAMEFEKLFARQLVQEMTKGLFEEDDNKGMMGSSGGGMYRNHIIDTLAEELAKQRKLGMADMVSRYLDKKMGISTKNNTEL